MFTCEELFLHLVGVENRCCDASHCANHTAQTQVNEHEKEHDGPERRRWEMSHGFCESDESQAGALYCLREKHTESKAGTQHAADTVEAFKSHLVELILQNTRLQTELAEVALLYCLNDIIHLHIV